MQTKFLNLDKRLGGSSSWLGGGEENHLLTTSYYVTNSLSTKAFDRRFQMMIGNRHFTSLI